MCVMVAAGSKYMDMHVDLMSWNSTQHTITVLSVPVKASVTRLHFCECFQAYLLNMSGWLPTLPFNCENPPAVIGWPLVECNLCFAMLHIPSVPSACYCYTHTHTHTHRVQTWLLLSALSSSEVSIPRSMRWRQKERERERKCWKKKKRRNELCRESKNQRTCRTS